MARLTRVRRRTAAEIAEANAVRAAARGRRRALPGRVLGVQPDDPQGVRPVRPVDPDDVRRPVLHAQAQLAAPLAMLAGHVALAEEPRALLEPLVHLGLGVQRWLSLSWWWACESRRGRSRRGSGRYSGLFRGADRLGCLLSGGVAPLDAGPPRLGGPPAPTPRASAARTMPPACPHPPPATSASPGGA